MVILVAALLVSAFSLALCLNAKQHTGADLETSKMEEGLEQDKRQTMGIKYFGTTNVSRGRCRRSRAVGSGYDAARLQLPVCGVGSCRLGMETFLDAVVSKGGTVLEPQSR